MSREREKCIREERAEKRTAQWTACGVDWREKYLGD